MLEVHRVHPLAHKLHVSYLIRIRQSVSGGRPILRLQHNVVYGVLGDFVPNRFVLVHERDSFPLLSS